METIECINKRRSIRLFTDEKVNEENIKELIECALNAPSSRDSQPWHFIIVKDEEKKKRLADMKSESNQQHILTSPVSVVVCVDTEKSPSRYIEDGVCATQNILLAAHALGLGSVYVTGSKESKPEIAKEIRDILDLPESIMPITILPIGYPNKDEKLAEKNKLKLEHVMHEDKW